MVKTNLESNALHFKKLGAIKIKVVETKKFNSVRIKIKVVETKNFNSVSKREFYPCPYHLILSVNKNMIKKTIKYSIQHT